MSDTYYLPGGEAVQIPEDVARGETWITFQRKTGEIVNAKRAAEPGSDEAFDFVAVGRDSSSGIMPMSGPIRRARRSNRGWGV